MLEIGADGDEPFPPFHLTSFPPISWNKNNFLPYIEIKGFFVFVLKLLCGSVVDKEFLYGCIT